MNRTFHIGFAALLLGVMIIFFSYSDLDQIIQNYCFDRTTHSWILDRNSQPYKFIFYDGIKKLLILFAVLLLMLVVFFRKKPLVQAYKKGLIIVILSSIFVPAAAGILKKETNMPCPKNTIDYEGKYPKTKVWESYPDTFKEPEIKCWPAGHASGGFALLSLLFLFRSKKMKTLSLLLAMTIGWSMGTYKMLIGDHFLSHTLITMLLAWLIILMIVKVVEWHEQSKKLLA